MKLIVVMAAIAVVAWGCSQPLEPSAKVTHVERESVISGTASLRHTYVLDRNSTFMTCAEPAPDSSFSQGESGGFSLSFLNFGSDEKDEKGEIAEQSEEVQLAGRTPAVLISREIFFRACEHGRNYGLTKAEAQAVFSKALGAITQVWAIEAGNTTIKVDDSDADNINQTITGSAPLLPAFQGSAQTQSTSATTQTPQALCTASGGTWYANDSQPCDCGSTKSYDDTTKKCA